MKSVNLRSLKSRLPHGSIVKIAESIGTTPAQVSHAINDGWYKNLHPAILEQAVTILEGQYPDDGLLDRAEDIGLTGGVSFAPKKKTKKQEASSSSSIGKVPVIFVLGILLVLAYMFIPAVKTAVANLIAKIKGQ